MLNRLELTEFDIIGKLNGQIFTHAESFKKRLAKVVISVKAEIQSNGEF